MTEWLKEHQFKAGQSGNPLGNGLDRHSTKTLTAKLRDLLEEEIDYKDLANTKKKMKISDALLSSLLAKALFKQDIQAMKIIYERLEGSAIQKTEDVTDYSKLLDKIKNAK
jgi:hypothetical protein